MNDDKGWVAIRQLDIAVSPLSADDVVAAISSASGGTRLLLNHNLHSAYLHQTDTEFRKLYRLADWVLIDGAPVLWFASWNLRSRLPSSLRIGSTDWLVRLSDVKMPRNRLFVFGATKESNSRAIARLASELPAWTVGGVDGYSDRDVALRLIRDFGPDLVIVGLGMPEQEYFLLRNYSELPTATYATVGGAIDYLAGATNLAPRWFGVFGLEWLWRLLCEPRRLWYRYLVEPILLFRLVMSKKWRSHWDGA